MTVLSNEALRTESEIRKDSIISQSFLLAV